MKRIVYLLLIVSLSSCSQKESQSVMYALDNPAERVVWERLRIADPNTGKIPKNIRKKEMMYASTLPVSKPISKSNWIHRGPYNVGGRTRALAFDILDENILFAGGASGGMFRSLDGGLSWEMTTKPNQLHNVTCLSQDKRSGKENIWYFGSGELTGSSASGAEAYYGGNGIYKSINGGLTWDSLSTTATNTNGFDSDFDFIWNIETDPSNDSLDVVYAATYGSIYRSEDGGDNWVKQLGGGSSYYTNIEVSSTGKVYATLSSMYSPSNDKGIWSSDDGLNWINITDSLFPAVYGRIAIAINPINEDEVYFLAAETDGYGQQTDIFFNGQAWTSLWKYDAGLHLWTDLSSSIPANQPTSFDNFNSQGGYDLLIKVHPLDPNTIYIGGTNLWRSTDGFTTSNNTMIVGGYQIGSSEGDGNWGVYENHHPDQHDLLFLPSNNNVILSATDGGVYKSYDSFADTVEWESLNNGYYTSQLYAATVSRNANSNVLHGGFQDNGNFITFSDDVNSHWKMPFNGDGAFAGIADNEEDFYLTIQRGVMYKMKLDNNANRLAFNRMDPASVDSNDYMFINPMTMDENSDIIYMAASNKLWRNNNISSIPYNNSHAKSDFGWHLFSDSLPNPNLDITVIETSQNPPNIVYLGTKYKKIFRVDNANIGDPSIEELTSPFTSSNAFVSDIAVNPNNANEIMVVYSNYSVYSIFHSSDGGQNWSKVAGNLEQNPSGSGNGPSCRTVEIIPIGSNTLYLVGTSVGLFGTSNLNEQSTVWEQISPDKIGSVVCEYLVYRKNDGLLIVATHGNGIYQTNINSLSDILSSPSIENSLNFKIYPNPVINKIQIELPNSLDVNSIFTIYDEIGKIIINRELNDLSNSKNNFTLDISNLRAGIYFASLRSKDMITTKQFIKK